MTQPLTELIETFCNYQRKQRGKTEGGVRAYRWNLEQLLTFIRHREGRVARVTDLNAPMIQLWMDDMAAADLALSTMRVRQSTLSSFCAWLVKRQLIAANPVAQLDRPPHRGETPRQVPGPVIMDALIEAAKQRRRPRDVAMFLILRYTGMRRESVARPSAVMKFLSAYVDRVLSKQVDKIGSDTPLFWSSWGRRRVGKTRAPMTGKNIWRLCKVYGRMIGCPA